MGLGSSAWALGIDSRRAVNFMEQYRLAKADRCKTDGDVRSR